MRTSPRTLPLLVTAAGVLLAGPILGATVLASEPTIVVQPGDTLGQLAIDHGVGVEELVSLNGIANRDRIYVGQRLILAAEETAAPAAAPSTVHVVVRGENLTWIARRYGTTVDAIVAANAIANPRLIFADQQLAIPGTAPAAAQLPAVNPPAAAPAPPAAPPIVHVVVRGENLTWIARRYETTVEAIVAANAIADPRLIFAGQQLAIPAAAPPSPADGPRAALSPEREAVRQMLIDEAGRFGVPAAFALAVAWEESGWKQGAVSSAGAVGVMQLLPATADWVSGAILGEPVDVRDARSNVRAGVALLAHYLGRYGSRELALAAYYQGQAGTDRHGIYPSSRAYINAVLALELEFAN